MILVGSHGGRCTTSSSPQVRPSPNTILPSLNSTQYVLPSFTTCRTSLRGPSRTLIDSLPSFLPERGRPARALLRLLYRPPHVLCRRRHLHIADAKRRQPIHDRIHDDPHGAHRSRLPRPLGAQP